MKAHQTGAPPLKAGSKMAHKKRASQVMPERALVNKDGGGEAGGLTGQAALGSPGRKTRAKQTGKMGGEKKKNKNGSQKEARRFQRLSQHFGRDGMDQEKKDMLRLAAMGEGRFQRLLRNKEKQEAKQEAAAAAWRWQQGQAEAWHWQQAWQHNAWQYQATYQQQYHQAQPTYQQQVQPNRSTGYKNQPSYMLWFNKPAQQGFCVCFLLEGWGGHSY